MDGHDQRQPCAPRCTQHTLRTTNHLQRLAQPKPRANSADPRQRDEGKRQIERSDGKDPANHGLGLPSQPYKETEHGQQRVKPAKRDEEPDMNAACVPNGSAVHGGILSEQSAVSAGKTRILTVPDLLLGWAGQSLRQTWWPLELTPFHLNSPKELELRHHFTRSGVWALIPELLPSQCQALP